MLYPEAIEYLYSLHLVGVKLGLRNISQVLACLGAPQQELRFVHLAGTNGKGSTAIMVAAILQHCGMRVGLYTSPHLRSFCERISINGAAVPTDEVAELVAQLKSQQREPPCSDSRTLEAFAGLTFFEFTTVVALRYFQRHQVDWVVWETGLGGRLDATNVVTPEVAILTPIALDHEQYLGSNAASIAAEKAGIVKTAVPVVTARQTPLISAVLKRRCADQQAPLIEAAVAGKRVTLTATRRGLTFSVRTARRTYDGLFLRQLGTHQCDNAVSAILACEELEAQGRLALSVRTVRDALAGVELPGRVQLLTEHPWVVLDGAHNPAAMAALTATLRSQFADQPLTLVLGIMRDKDLDGIVREIAPLAHQAIVAVPRLPRSAPPAELRRRLLPFGIPCQVAGSVVEACNQALASAHDNDVLCVTGSFYTVGEALAWWEAAHPRALTAAGPPPLSTDAPEMQF